MEEKLDLLLNIDASIEELLEVATKRKQLDIEVWLDAIKYDDPCGKFITSHLEGTCDWILSHPAYVTWESQDSEEDVAKLLWIYGPAGFGKTILSAWLVHHIEKTLKLPLAYCFSSNHAQRINELDDMVRTWITQLIRKDTVALDLVHRMRQKQNTRRASRDDVWTLLKELVTQIQSCVLVLDGLDEVRSVDDSRKHFLRDLKKAVQSTRVRVLLTSRNEYDIESELHSLATETQKHTILNCKISEENVQKDIDLVSSFIVAERLPGQEDSLRQELARKMAERCHGQFLWLKLQQGQLRDSKSPKALQKIVQAMPAGLHSSYRRKWNGIQALEEPDRSRAVDTLRWLTFSYRPLIVQELAEALIVNLDSGMEAFSEDDLPRTIDDGYIDGEIKTLCGSLVELREGKSGSGPKFRLVHLVHASVNDFLVAELPVSPLLGSLPDRPQTSAAQHVQLAAHCIRFLDCSKAWEPNEGNDCRLFTTYAVNAWFRHLKDSDHYYENISDHVNNFMRPGNDNFEKWKKMYESEDGSPSRRSATALYYASLFGLLPAMDFLHDNEDLDINSVGGQFGTPLQAACTEGYTEAFERLVLWKADVTVRGGQFSNALNAAAYYGRIGMVKAIIGTGAPAYSQGHETHEAMRMAAGKGHEEVVRLLLDEDANVNPPGPSYPFRQQFGESKSFATPLHAAAKNNHLDVLKLLLERGADPNIPNDDENTALHLAASNNFHEGVGLLLQHGATADSQGTRGAPLHVAAFYGYLTIVVQLTDGQADLDACNKYQLTPLHHAAVNGHSDVVSFLIQQGANINAQGIFGWTPLHLAARNGHIRAVTALVGKGADMNIQNKDGWTPLHFAIRHGNLELAKFLLQKGTTSKSTNYGSMPLHFAAENGFLDLVLSIIQTGADKDAQNHNGWTPLHFAVDRKHPDVVESLLEHGVAIKADEDGWTPLHIAAEQAQLNITVWLLERGADINARVRGGSTPLSIAIQPQNEVSEVSEQQRLEEVKLLLKQGATFGTDDKGFTPLHAAAREGYSQIVSLFLDQGEDINAQSNNGLTALMLAIIENDFDTAELLMSRGADVNIQFINGVTALHVAAEKDSPKFAQSVLERNCNINAKSTDGTSPLHMAIAHGADEVVQYLIRSGADLDAMDCYGMKCSDWLKRLRPHLTVPQSKSQEIDDIPAGPDMAVLRRTVFDSATRIRRDEAEKPDEFYHLAHCFLLLGMEDDAKIAFHQEILVQDDCSTCDECHAISNKIDPFFACKTCPDTDLCKICIEKHKKEVVKKICRDHDFMRIVASEAKTRPDDTEAYNEWLDRIVGQFRDA